MDVELQSGSFFACFEEAVTTYGTEVYQQQIAQSFSGLQGGIQGSAVNTTLPLAAPGDAGKPFAITFESTIDKSLGS